MNEREIKKQNYCQGCGGCEVGQQTKNQGNTKVPLKTENLEAMIEEITRRVIARLKDGT